MDNDLIFRKDARHAVLHNEGQSAVAAVQEINAVDAVPVVRCGECRWWSKDEPDDEYGYCYNGKIIGSTKENWHCADGERKDGDRK